MDLAAKSGAGSQLDNSSKATKSFLPHVNKSLYTAWASFNNSGINYHRGVRHASIMLLNMEVEEILQSYMYIYNRYIYIYITL